jgi:hypothetical protein
MRNPFRKYGLWVALITILCVVGLQLVPDARMRTVFVGGTSGTTYGGTSWSNWDETTEAGWGSSNVFVALMENTSAGGNETGQGLVTGADLVLTQSGNVAGASGNSRWFDGANDYLSGTTTLTTTALKDRTSWTILMKLNTLNAGSDISLCFGLTSGASNHIYIEQNGGAMKVNAYDNGNLRLGTATADTYPTAGDVYFAVWGSPGYNIRAGFTTTKPTKWSDFAATKRVEGTAAVTWAGTWSINHNFICYSAGSSCTNVRVYYVLLASECLIDNAS